MRRPMAAPAAILPQYDAGRKIKTVRHPSTVHITRLIMSPPIIYVSVGKCCE